MIPYGKQDINDDDIKAVVSVLKSDFLTQGPKVSEFEKDLSTYCGSRFVKVVNSATAALHLSYLAVGLKKDDIVWTTPNTFVATANAALFCGATVDFVDIDPKTYNLSIESLKVKLVKAKKEGNLPKLVVPVHFAGQSCEMKDIWNLSKEYKFKVIEDASHALGGDYLNKKVGCCEYSHLTVFSFHPVKMITTGEGGAILTNIEALANNVEILRSHGITKDNQKFKNHPDGDWYYEQQVLGFNYRLTDIQAALGISQLNRLNSFVDKRRKIAQRYFNELNNIDLPFQHNDSNSSWHLFVVQIKNRKAIYERLRELGILSQVHYIPVSMQPFYNQSLLNNSGNFYKHCLSLPIYPSMSEEDQTKVITSL